MCSLKNLAMLKCESRTSLYAVHYFAVHYMQYTIILIMASLDTLFSCSVGQQAWLCS